MTPVPFWLTRRLSTALFQRHSMPRDGSEFLGSGVLDEVRRGREGLVRLLNSLRKRGLRQALHRSELAGAGETAGLLVIGLPSNKATAPPLNMRPVLD